MDKDPRKRRNPENTRQESLTHSLIQGKNEEEFFDEELMEEYSRWL